jgi:hypothetical protein
MALKDLKYAPRRTTLRLILDDNVRAELEAARTASKTNTDHDDLSSAGESTRRLEEAEAAAEEAAATFVFEAIPRVKLQEMIADCPPTSEQLDRWKEKDRNNPLVSIEPPKFNYDKFAPRLIAKSLVEPETSESEVVEMWEDGEWGDAIWAALWVAAWDKTNLEVSVFPTSGIGSKKT